MASPEDLRKQAEEKIKEAEEQEKRIREAVALKLVAEEKKKEAEEEIRQADALRMSQGGGFLGF